MTTPTPDMGRQAAVAQRRSEAIKLRLAGATYQQIADSDLYPPGTSRAEAYVDIKRAFQQAQREIATDTGLLLTEDLLRLDRLLLANWQQALNGNIRATEICLKIIDKRTKLLGTEAPTRHVWESESEVDRAIRDLEQQLGDQTGSGAPPQ